MPPADPLYPAKDAGRNQVMVTVGPEKGLHHPAKIWKFLYMA